MKGRTYVVAFQDKHGHTFNECLSYGTTPSAAIRNLAMQSTYYWRLVANRTKVKAVPL
jgi:hypothetical protein